MEGKGKEFIEGCIHMMMDTCGIREYTINDGADKLLQCRFIIDRYIDIEYLKEKMTVLSQYVEFVSDWRI